MMSIFRSTIYILLFTFLGTKGMAHESRPLFIEIVETNPSIYELRYKIPSSVPEFNLPEVTVEIPEFEIEEESKYRTRTGFLKSRRFSTTSGLNNQKIVIQYPILNPSVSAIIRIETLEGITYNHLLPPDNLDWVIPEKETRWGVAKEYTQLGIKHILEGWDHLLFLICLIFVAGISRKLIITITGFTLAHSLTLVLAAMNVVNVPIPPVEAVIALSVVFLASEIAVNNQASLTYKYPIAVSGSFGLLHGFGFASVLSDIGLPQTEITTSLLFFNVGVEIGQIIFVLFIVLLMAIYQFARSKTNFATLGSRVEFIAKQIAIYATGSIACYWMIERLWGFI